MSEAEVKGLITFRLPSDDELRSVDILWQKCNEHGYTYFTNEPRGRTAILRFLRGFLKAKIQNIDHAFQAIERTIQWRRDNCVDSIFEELHVDTGLKAALDKGLLFHHGFDKQRRPVLYGIAR
jgi:hypothetical protein